MFSVVVMICVTVSGDLEECRTFAVPTPVPDIETCETVKYEAGFGILEAVSENIAVRNLDVNINSMEAQCLSWINA